MNRELQALTLPDLLARVSAGFAALETAGARWGRDDNGEVGAAEAKLGEAEAMLAALKADLATLPERRDAAIRAGDVHAAMQVQKRHDDAPAETAIAELAVIEAQIRHREALGRASGEIARAGRLAGVDLGDCLEELRRRRDLALRPVETARSMATPADVGELRDRRQRLLERIVPLSPVMRNLSVSRR